MELGSERFFDLLAESFLHKATCLAAFAADKAFGLHVGLSGGRHDYLYEFQAAPPTWIETLIEPSESDCSVNEYPRLRASMRALSTAYACKNESSSRCSPQRPPKLS